MNSPRHRSAAHCCCERPRCAAPPKYNPALRILGLAYPFDGFQDKRHVEFVHRCRRWRPAGLWQEVVGTVRAYFISPPRNSDAPDGQGMGARQRNVPAYKPCLPRAREMPKVSAKPAAADHKYTRIAGYPETATQSSTRPFGYAPSHWRVLSAPKRREAK